MSYTPEKKKDERERGKGREEGREGEKGGGKKKERKEGSKVLKV